MNVRAPSLVLLVMACVAVTRSQQEKVIVLEHADSLVGKILDGEEVRELIGHVRFRQGTVAVSCDRAVQFLKTRKVSLHGNVLVRDDTVTMRGKRGMYYNADRVAEAYDGVRLDDGKTVLTADYGRYHVDAKKAFFRSNVVVEDSASTLKADSLTYYREDKRSIADGEVQIHNTGDNVTILGGHFENFTRQQFSRMTLHPVVVQVDTSGATPDTFTVRSRVMESYRDSTKRLVAIDSVRIAGSLLSGEAGIAVFLTDADSIVLKQNPFVWYEESQVSGDSIFIKLLKRKPETVYVRGDPFAISRSDSLYTKRFDQLTGELITMRFSGGRIRRIDVNQTATSVYFLFEDRKDSAGTSRRPNGLNKTTGDHVAIYFVDGKADRISVVGGVEGEYFPENLVDGREPEYYLPGFNWREDHPGAKKTERSTASEKNHSVGKSND